MPGGPLYFLHGDLKRHRSTLKALAVLRKSMTFRPSLRAITGIILLLHGLEGIETSSFKGLTGWRPVLKHLTPSWRGDSETKLRIMSILMEIGARQR